MKRFTIYGHHEKGHVAIKNGFSWPAFFLVDFWALYNCLFLVLIVNIIVSSILSVLDMKLFLILTLIVRLFYGNYGNSWLEVKYMGTGYEYKGVIEANNSNLAIELYIRRITKEEEARKRKIEQEREIEEVTQA